MNERKPEESTSGRGWKFGVSPYLTSEEAADYTRFRKPDGSPNVKAFYKWVDRHGVTKLHCGRSLRFDAREIDRVLLHPHYVRKVQVA